MFICSCVRVFVYMHLFSCVRMCHCSCVRVLACSSFLVFDRVRVVVSSNVSDFMFLIVCLFVLVFVSDFVFHFFV